MNEGLLLFLSLIGIILIIINITGAMVLNKNKNIGKNLSDLGKELKKTSDAETNMVNLLPDKLGTSVLKGVSPLVSEIGDLKQELGKSLQEIQSVTLTLNKDGYLAEWLNELKANSSSNKNLNDEIQTHYETNRQILENFEKFFQESVLQRGKIEKTYLNLEDIFSKWAVGKESYNREIEERIMDRLKEVGQENALVSKNLSEMQTTLEKLASTNEKLNSSVLNITGNVLEITENQENVSKEHKKLIENQKKTAEEIVKLLENINSITEIQRRNILDFTSVLESHKKSFKDIIENNNQIFLKAESIVQNLPSKIQQDETNKRFIYLIVSQVITSIIMLIAVFSK